MVWKHSLNIWEPILGPTNKPIYSVIIAKGAIRSDVEVWFTQIQFLLFLRAGKNVENTNVIIRTVHGIRTTCRRGKLHFSALQCTMVYREWKGLHCTKICPREDVVGIGVWCGDEQLYSLMGTTHLTRSKSGLHPFTEIFPWSYHQFLFNCINKSCRVGASREAVENMK